MTLNEWLERRPAMLQCQIPDCDWNGSAHEGVLLCSGHQRQLEHLGQPKFDATVADLAQIKAANTEAFRQWYFVDNERLKAEIRATRDAQHDLADKYLA